MKDTFKFLTGDDERLLMEKSQRLSYGPGEEIISEGSPRQALFFLRGGRVAVQRGSFGGTLELSRLGPGEIFGEMSFVDDSGASATVIADSDVEVDVIEGAQVQSLLYSVPGLAARFYQSLAVTLSERLRAMIDHPPE